MQSNDTAKENNEATHQYCSYAATGPLESFQPIFVCHSCCSDEKLHCVCQACADECHGKHEGLEYVGEGPCYCDCHELGCCKIKDISESKAGHLGVVRGSCCQIDTKQQDQSHSGVIYQVYQMRILDDKNVLEKLVNQATELVRHSKETFWIDQSCFCDGSSLSELEEVAWIIYQHHITERKLQETELSGAEWWVQVKPSSSGPIEPSALTKEAIDLHYDKDEELAANFALGAFPSLSTVTYLTASKDMASTIVFFRRYEEDEEAPISEMLVSHPRSQKHLVFDGNLLHGAPSHHLLRMQSPHEGGEKNAEGGTLRITFLVNIWITHKPLNVQILPDDIREKLKTCTANETDESASLLDCENVGIFEKYSPVPVIVLTSTKQLPKDHQERLELPFVGGQATWTIHDSEENDESVVLSTFPPPAHEEDTILVKFGPGLQAFMHSTDCNSNQSA